MKRRGVCVHQALFIDNWMFMQVLHESVIVVGRGRMLNRDWWNMMRKSCQESTSCIDHQLAITKCSLFKRIGVAILGTFLASIQLMGRPGLFQGTKFVQKVVTFNIIARRGTPW